jgi:hypothetical protein
MAETKDAKNGAPAADAKKEKAPKKRGKATVVLSMIIFGASAWFIFPTLILFLIGMAPTLVALFTDSDRQKSSAAAVGAMNAAGVTPFIIDLWVKGQTMENVFQILSNSTDLLIILGAAAIGQLIIFAVPQAVALLSFARADARLKIMRHNLESLRDSWGPDVGTTKPIDKIGGSS